MTIKEFIEGYHENTTDTARSKYIKENLIVRNYVGFNNKCDIASRIVNASTFVFDEEGNQTSEIKINSIARALLTSLATIDAYTNLDINFDTPADEYDLLVESGMIERLIGIGENPGLIPPREISELNAIVNMMFDDALQNNLSTHAFVSNQVTRFGTLIGTTLSPIMETIADNLNNLDEKSVEKIANQIDKVLKRIK